MPVLRTCLFSLPLSGLLLGTGLLAGAQTLPAVPAAAPGSGGDAVTIIDASTDGGVRQGRIRVLSATDHDLFLRAFEAASRGDWVAARNLASQGQNSLARKLVEWRYALDRNSGATFAEIDAVIKDTENKTSAAAWPLRGTLQARAEAQITPELPPATVAAWFATRTPNSSIGKIRLGEALIAAGDKARGAVLIRNGWAEGSFDTDTEQSILQNDAAFLTPESDRARLDNLLWRREIAAAKRQVARVEGPAAGIANARIALGSYGFPKAEADVNKVQGSADPGLLFDWSRALRLANRDREAHAMLLKVPAAPMVKDNAARWWSETNAQARDALANGDPRLALELVEHAGFASGDQYAEQQFLAGFIALRFLKDPNAALAAFQRLDAAVARPISKSRAQYWQGRAYEALGDTGSALTRYRQAALYPETFYGQVALARIDANPVLHLNETVVEAVSASDVDADALMPQIKILAELGQAGSLRQFIERYVEVHPSPRHIKRLMLLLTDWGYPEIAVRLAKGLSYTGTMLPTFTHPVIALPPYPGPGDAPDPALVLGLIRQETEFDAYAISSAGARGLMQMMPASAKVAASRAKLPYRPGALLSDTRYNMQLGMTEYSVHLDRYGGSWVLAAAAYNAGPNNAKKWLANGDPRVGDPIDWIEQIPFGETRNYVQRILENAQVYRARLAGKDAPLKILQNLYAPGQPSTPILAAK